ncbi:MAG: hypothetical protein KDC67_12010, partial [Ignavibacteriae bacterium]|nr:hypothetical protein [Ignavibacteriota bacterium]
MRKIAKILLYLIFLIPSIKIIAQDEPDEVGNFIFDGLDRRYEVYLPQNITSNMPLVISIHGYSEDIAWYKDYTRMHEAADTMGYVIVYPQGISKSWNVGVVNPNESYPSTDDVGFISALIDTMKSHWDIDLSRVYYCGFSLGGEMSFRLVGDIGHRIAAIGSVSGPLFGLADSWYIVRPMPILYMHGDSDNLVPFEGKGDEWAVQKVIDYWLDKNQCEATPDTFLFPDIVPNDNCTIQKISYTNCSGESHVVHYKGIGMGHSWPSSTFTFGSEGNKNMDINANVEILNFFNNYQNPLVNLAYTKSLKFSIPKFLNTDDTLKVVVKLANPDQHPVNVLAYIESELSVQRDSLLLYDNGLQGDVVAFDNLFTVHQKMSDFGKDYYTLSLGAKDLTEDVTTNYRLHWNFTNIGRIIMGDKPYSYTDRDPDHYLSLAIKNVDTQIIDGIVVNLSTEDDRVSLVEVNDVSFGNIEPGTEVSGKNQFIFYYSGDYNSDSTKNKPILFNVKIFRNGTHYWSDSFKFSTDETCPDPPTNLKAEVDSTNSTVNLS